MRKAGYLAAKCLLDVLAAALLLGLMGPLMLVIGLLIRLGSAGPAIFRQERAGKGGKPFVCYKFRTMRSDVDPYGASPRDGSDPRITRIGRWLRETSLDELPQLLNVLKGQMSLVGPRPLYIRQAAEWDARQRRRLEVKPGLTGLAQISGRADLTIEDKLELDVRYVEQAGLWLDLCILWRTFLLVLTRRQGIYEKRYSRSADIEGAALERNRERSDHSL
jgi:lipopolysaccharide/colanic/teichoic acid biosynthesis glycosyltransferase